MTCTNPINEDPDIECGDEGRLCAECWGRESARWARHFGQDYGTREEKRARLEAMHPRPPCGRCGGSGIVGSYVGSEGGQFAHDCSCAT
jgi:hypothetical protein